MRRPDVLRRRSRSRLRRHRRLHAATLTATGSGRPPAPAASSPRTARPGVRKADATTRRAASTAPWSRPPPPATCGDSDGTGTAYACTSGQFPEGGEATECPESGCDDPTCCVDDSWSRPPPPATCGDSDGTGTAYACTSGQFPEGGEATECPESGCDDPTCCVDDSVSRLRLRRPHAATLTAPGRHTPAPAASSPRAARPRSVRKADATTRRAASTTPRSRLRLRRPHAATLTAPGRHTPAPAASSPRTARPRSVRKADATTRRAASTTPWSRHRRHRRHRRLHAATLTGRLRDGIRLHQRPVPRGRRGHGVSGKRMRRPTCCVDDSVEPPPPHAATAGYMRRL